MLSLVCKRVHSAGFAVKGVSSLLGRRSFAEASKPIEFDIIENMKTYPLFGEKVQGRLDSLCDA